MRLSTVLVGTRPDLAAPRKGEMGGVGLFSGKKCTVGRLVANLWTTQQHDGGRVVEIGANRQSCDPCATLVLKIVFEVVLGSTQASFPG